MKKVIMIRYAEIFLKGKNRGFFERMLEENIRKALQGVSCKLVKQNCRYAIEEFEDEQTEEIIEKLKRYAVSIPLALPTKRHRIWKAFSKRRCRFVGKAVRLK